MTGYDQHAHCARCRDKKEWTDPCVKNQTCPSCNILTEDQKLKLATPSYQRKKEKRELKMQTDQSSSTLIDPALVSEIGVAKDGESRSSEEASSTPTGAKVKKIAVSSEEASSYPAKANKSQQSPEDGVVKDKGKKTPLHRPDLQELPLTQNLRPWTLNGWKDSVGWKLCFYLKPSLRLNRPFNR